MLFTFEEQPSTASKLFLASATDANGKLVQFHIACDDNSQLQSIAEETYAVMTKVPDYAKPTEGAAQ